MKLNWGTGIVFAFISFIAFILYFVIRMNTDSSTDHELVAEEYYELELGYQTEIDAEKNASRMNAKLKLVKTDEGLQISFPETFDIEKITGNVSLYRPSNRHLDFDLPISLSSTHLLIPDKRLLDGRWDITVKWEYEDNSFLFKEKLNY